MIYSGTGGGSGVDMGPVLVGRGCKGCCTEGLDPIEVESLINRKKGVKVEEK